MKVNISLSPQTYREFKSKEEAEMWAWKYYSDLLNLPSEDALHKIISSYTGSYYKAYNQLLRLCPPLNSDKFKHIDFEDRIDDVEEIYKIDCALRSYSLPENIIVYRFTHKKDVHKLCDKKFLCAGAIFSDRAFFSTTLVRDIMNEFRKQNRCDCMLKIYLTQGLPGAYVSFKEEWSCLDEQEFLLPPNTKFRILKIHHFTYPLEIECIAVCD